MSLLVTELDATLSQLDPTSAANLERLIRGAISLAEQMHTPLDQPDDKGWPAGYWETYEGRLAHEPWDWPARKPE